VNVRRALERAPVDREAEERAWAVVREAFREREPVRAPRIVVRRRIVLAAAAVVAACVAAALSAPGRAVVDAVRRSIGISHAAPALFRLPAPGRLLASGGGGTWVVAADGSKRRLGDWTSAAWSPHGLYVVTWSRNGLAAVEPTRGEVHWSLARPVVSLARWGGSRVDTRVAYLSGASLRVVAGDGTGDRVVAAAVARVAPAWQPERHVLAYATRDGRVVVRDVDSGAVVRTLHLRARFLAWSSDGRRLAVVTATGVDVIGARRERIARRGVQAVAFAPKGTLALLGERSVLVDGPEGLATVLRVAAPLAGLAWSPDSRWLVTSLPGADQWLFVGRHRLLAVSHIARELGGAMPSLDGWEPGA
jgi:anaphase-promoting complex subunit 4